MTRSLRRRHYLTFLILGVLLPITLAIGVAARNPVPRLANLSAELNGPSRPSLVTVWERNDLFRKNSIQVRLVRGVTGPADFAVDFSAPSDFVKPDLLVYYTTTNPGAGDSLPGDARLLGAFASSPLGMPQISATTNGYLILYSLADQEIVEASPATQFSASIN